MPFHVFIFRSYYWNENCSVKGHDLVKFFNFRSFQGCARECKTNKDCNYFTLDASSGTCTLKKVPDSDYNVITTRGTTCGFLESRISPTANGPKWETGRDKSFTYAQSCDFFGADISGGKYLPNFEECGLYCSRNPDCNYFSYGITSKWCYPKRSTDILNLKGNMDRICGFIPIRRFNKELFV